MTVYRCCVATLAAAQGESGRGRRSPSTPGTGAVEFEIALTGARVEAGALDPVAARVEALGGSLDIAPDRVAGRLPLTS